MMANLFCKLFWWVLSLAAEREMSQFAAIRCPRESGNCSMSPHNSRWWGEPRWTGALCCSYFS
jgi:hypothetical protein